MSEQGAGERKVDQVIWWIMTVAVGVVSAIALAWTASMSGAVKAVDTAAAMLSSRVAVLEVRSGALETRLDRIERKLDTLIERSGK